MAPIAPARIPADHLLAALHARKRVPGYRHFCAALSPCLGGRGGIQADPAGAMRSRSVRSSTYVVWLVEL